MDLNSESYWETRFKTDWNEVKGKRTNFNTL